MTSGTLTGSNEPHNTRLGVVTRNVVPVHAEPDDDSEQTTQTLMGQSITVSEDRGEWLRVRTWDTYEGWIQSFNFRDVDTPYAACGTVVQITNLWADILNEPHSDAGIVTKVTIGVELETGGKLDDWLQLHLPDGSTGYIPTCSARLIERHCPASASVDIAELTRTAKRMVGVPYLWGGSSVFGLDCSGFVQLIYRTQGVTLPRDAWMQASDLRCEPVEKSALRPGDLLFFAKGLPSGNEKITHVGLMLDNNSFIHSCGSYGVIISSLDDPYYAKVYLKATRLQLSPE